jgi:hypothetical protein
MSNLPVGRNDLCSCGSGKKFKRCCLRRRRSEQGVTASIPKDILQKMRELVDECVILRDLVDCIGWIFGRDFTPLRPKWWAEFEGLRQILTRDNGLERLRVADPVASIKRLESMRSRWQQIRDEFKSNILCSDDELRTIAGKVKNEGGVWFSKTEFDHRFSFSFTCPFWRFVPDYARITILRGKGIALSSPEIDMFISMCRSHDRAVLSGRELEAIKQKDLLDKSWNTESRRFVLLHGDHRLEVRQVVINACLFVEAFVNSVAHAYRSNPTRPLSREDKIYLQERILDKKTGVEREKFVALQDKLYRWIQLISPRGETFDKGANPYQAFRAIQEYRDSIVHISTTKADKYHAIYLPIAIQAVDVSLDIVQAICHYIAPDPEAIAYPTWLVSRKDDGLFHITAFIEPCQEAQSEGGEGT